MFPLMKNRELVNNIIDLHRLENETSFEWKLRLCKAKLNKELDLDWIEIVEILGLDVSADHLRKTAYGMMEYDEYIHGFEGVATTILSISDMHVPFELPITLLSEYIGKIDILQINGDVVDCQALSKFSKQYRISPMEEMIKGRQYLIDLIEYIKPKKVICNYGNHDKRFANYFAKNLDTDILELLPDTSLELILIDGFKHYDKRSKSKIEYKPLKDVFDDIVEFSELREFMDVPVKNYSSGMLSRLAFSIATSGEADILIVDEVLSVGDFRFQEKCQERIHRMMDKGTTVLFVSHSIEQVREICNKVVWLESGKVRMKGDAAEICDVYMQTR